MTAGVLGISYCKRRSIAAFTRGACIRTPPRGDLEEPASECASLRQLASPCARPARIPLGPASSTAVPRYPEGTFSLSSYEHGTNCASAKRTLRFYHSMSFASQIAKWQEPRSRRKSGECGRRMERIEQAGVCNSRLQSRFQSLIARC